jgi:hypothetical protein
MRGRLQLAHPPTGSSEAASVQATNSWPKIREQPMAEHSDGGQSIHTPQRRGQHFGEAVETAWAGRMRDTPSSKQP